MFLFVNLWCLSFCSNSTDFGNFENLLSIENEIISGRASYLDNLRQELVFKTLSLLVVIFSKKCFCFFYKIYPRTISSAPVLYSDKRRKF